MVTFKFKYTVLGGHTHVIVYSGKTPGSLGRCGAFVMRNEEWAAFKSIVNDSASSDILVDFMEER